MSANMNNLYGNLVNIDNSHFSGNAFTSRVIPNFQLNPNALQEPASNVQGANSYIPCAKGGAKIHRKTKIHRKKINNISNMYKMKGGKKTMKKRVRMLKSKIRSRFVKKSKKTHSRKHRRLSRRQRGGYSQYQNNMPLTPSYSLGGVLQPSLSAMANPPPYTVLSNNANCVDNYNHVTNTGFPSKGS